MLDTQSEQGWRTELAPLPSSYPRDFTGSTQRGREDDSIVDRAGGTGRRSTILADLWRIFEEMKAVDPNVTDREVVNAYQSEHPRRPRVTTKTLRALRYRRRVCEKKQLATAVTSR